MSKKWSPRAAWVALMAFLALVLVADLVAADDKKKKRKKKKRKKEAVEQVSAKKVLRQVNRDLWAYATTDARAALEPVLNEENPAHLQALGRILAQEKSLEESAAKISAACALAPEDPAHFVYLGEIHLLADQEAEAATAFGRAAELAGAQVAADPESFWGHYHLGVAEQRRRSYAASRAALERALELDPGKALAIYQLGLTHAFEESWEAAVARLNEALEIDSGLAYGYYYRGLSHGKTGRKDLMINDLDRFLTLAPEAPEAKRAERLVNAASR